MITDKQAYYFKEFLTLKNSGDSVARIGTSLMESKISLNPHQINASLKFFRNPFIKGLILADEVGLGKTIEAGLIISQYWYERKRRILIIAPSSLLKQWSEELFDKFHLESTILDGQTLKSSSFTWSEGIYITSMHSIYINKDVFKFNFHLIAIDEAHKLRNVYKNSGIMAPAIKEVFEGKKKLLLTATPFQNNLMELYGIVSLIDDDILGDQDLFKNKYITHYDENKVEFKRVLDKYIVRTLRKDVKKYINYTKRRVEVFKYKSTKEEMKLYNMISNLLYSNDFLESYNLGQNQLMIILLQKLLSSSVYAVKSTLNNMLYNLKNSNAAKIVDDTLDDFEEVALTLESIDGLVKNIESCLDYAKKLEVDSKYDSLVKALKQSFELVHSNKERNRKILIFTESKKTQEYLCDRLLEDGFDKILSFNGENNSEIIKNVYGKWVQKHNRIVSSNKSVNVRRAIIDAFEHEYEILIATDAAAEGLNIQFCSIMINYDLPWNPQKIEQRIGRCHRYGQKNDVIVINLLNSSSSIDVRVYDLLSSKLGIFEETFGSSDAILGKTEISDDIETSIRNIYKTCRSPEEIENAFVELQKQYKEEIEESLKETEKNLEKYFDQEIQNTFDLQFVEAKKVVNEMEEMFFKLIKYVYPNEKYNDDNYTFFLANSKHLMTISNELNQGDLEYCSINGKIGQYVLNTISENFTPGIIELDYKNSNQKIGFVDNEDCKTGIIALTKITYDSFEITEKLVLTGYYTNEVEIPEDICHKLLKLDSRKTNGNIACPNITNKHKENVDNAIKSIEEHNNVVFKEESNYINNWADNKIEKIQLNVSEMRLKRKEIQLEFDYSTNVQTKELLQEQISQLSRKISKSWMELADAEDEIESRRQKLICNLSKERNKNINIQYIFEVEFRIV